MTYVVNEPCIATNPRRRRGLPGRLHPPHARRDGLRRGEQLYLDPEECIDREACVSRTALCRRGSDTALITAAAAT